MVTFISHRPAETVALGEEWGRLAWPGWVIGLSGELGAGKTQLAKGLAQGLGVTDAVRSPTFVLVHEYAGGRLPLAHLDFYRLDTPQQIAAAGLEDYLFQSRGVTVVEWIERWLGTVPRAEDRGSSWESKAPGSGLDVQRWPAQFRWVKLEQVGETERRITYEDFGH